MKIPFWKMHGAGNDFILLKDLPASASYPTAEQIHGWCRHHTGVGADGVLLVLPAATDHCHFRMKFFNPDGSAAEMCGNGARCIARFAYEHGIAPDRMRFETDSGTISAYVQHDTVTLDLPLPKDIKLQQKLPLASGTLTVDHVNTGVPHTIVTCPDVHNIDLSNIGLAIRYHARYAPGGTNVDFIQIISENTLRIRTYERGVEQETLACGTGVAAAAVACVLKKTMPSRLHVKTAGGDELTITTEIQQDAITRLQLAGPAVLVFDGNIHLDAEPV